MQVAVCPRWTCRILTPTASGARRKGSRDQGKFPRVRIIRAARGQHTSPDDIKSRPARMLRPGVSPRARVSATSRIRLGKTEICPTPLPRVAWGGSGRFARKEARDR